MTTAKQVALTVFASLLLGIGSLAIAEESETEILVSGDEPMNVDDAAQITEPDPNAAEQEATEEQMEKVDEETGAISGKYD